MGKTYTVGFQISSVTLFSFHVHVMVGMIGNGKMWQHFMLDLDANEHTCRIKDGEGNEMNKLACTQWHVPCLTQLSVSKSLQNYLKWMFFLITQSQLSYFLFFAVDTTLHANWLLGIKTIKCSWFTPRLPNISQAPSSIRPRLHCTYCAMLYLKRGPDPFKSCPLNADFHWRWSHS